MITKEELKETRHMARVFLRVIQSTTVICIVMLIATFVMAR